MTMTETPQAQRSATDVPQQTRGQERVSRRRAAGAAEPTAWAGWVVFGAIMMVMVGGFHAMAGLVALFKDEYYVVGEAGLVVNVDYTAWGWVHIGLGAIAIAAGLALLVGQMWARVVGIAMAVVSALLNFGFIAAYPLWSITMITLDVLVIYAIAMHGRELKEARA
jgi:hypothetical protein